MIFTWLDLIIPWAVSLGTAAICGYGVYGGDTVAGKIISGLTGLAFLAFIPLWYWMRSKCFKADYVLENGLRVMLGKRNRPPIEAVRYWALFVENFWEKRKGERVKDMWKIGSTGKRCIFLDSEAITIWGRLVRGYSTSTDIVVGFPISAVDFESGKNYVRDLFGHEASHHALNAAGMPWNEKLHHAEFESANFIMPA